MRCKPFGYKFGGDVVYLKRAFIAVCGAFHNRSNHSCIVYEHLYTASRQFFYHLGAEFSVDWAYRENTVDAVRELKDKGHIIIGVEQTENSVSADSFLNGERRLERDKKYAVIFGNEVHGISQEAVDLCDWTLEIPQWGTKHSLNVSVAIGIVLYVLTPR